MLAESELQALYAIDGTQNQYRLVVQFNLAQ